MANPFNFDSGEVLTAANLNAIGDWTSWTPTWTDLTVGNATNLGAYAEVNELVFVTTKLTWGSTTSTTSYFEHTLPVAADNTTQYQLSGNCILYNVGTAIHVGTVNVASNSAFPYASYYSSGIGAAIYAGNIDGSAPFSWTTGDLLYMSYWYRRAAIS